MAAPIAWHDGSLADARALARASGRPLLLYWGAVWCPPCNRLKAELLSRADCRQRIAGLVAFQLDGDQPGAQALAAQLRLRSYPTLLLLDPDGAEITRLPCELEGGQFVAALDRALAATTGAARLVTVALDGGTLQQQQWDMLSYYSWDTDEGSALGQSDPAATLLALAAACPAPAAAARLGLHARLAGGGAEPALHRVLADAALARANLDLLIHHGAVLLKTAAEPRAPLAQALAGLARDWVGDASLAPSERLGARRLQVRMARLGAPAEAGLAAQLQAEVAATLAGADDAAARHTLLNTAFSALNDAGLPDQAQALLQAALATSHAPYYFMLSLAAGARRRGDPDAMLAWYDAAWRGVPGLATRVQWGVTYLLALLEWAPADERVEQLASGLLATLDACGSDAFCQRNLSQWRRLLAPLAAQQQAGAQAGALLQALNAGIR